MVIGVIGESCVGKSTLAKHLAKEINAEVFHGNDYLRLEKDENNAKKIFVEMLKNAVKGSHIIYVISEKEHLTFLPDDAIRVLITADLKTIKNRFAARTNGILPKPVELMIEKKHGMFDNEICNLHFECGRENLENMCHQIKMLV